MLTGCYICRPEDPNVAEEGCERCEAAFYEWFIVVYADEIAAAEVLG